MHGEDVQAVGGRKPPKHVRRVGARMSVPLFRCCAPSSGAVTNNAMPEKEQHLNYIKFHPPRLCNNAVVQFSLLPSTPLWQIVPLSRVHCRFKWSAQALLKQVFCVASILLNRFDRGGVCGCGHCVQLCCVYADV